MLIMVTLIKNNSKIKLRFVAPTKLFVLFRCSGDHLSKLGKKVIRHFTLLELLMVMFIILIFITVLFPVLAKGRERARFSKWAGFVRDSLYDTSTMALYDFQLDKGSDILDNKAYGLEIPTYEQEAFDGQLINAPEIETGRWRNKKALLFNGIDTYVDCGTSLDLSDISFSISIWAKRSALSGTPDLFLGHGQPMPNKGLNIGFTSTNQFRFSFFANDLDTPTGYTDTLQYHHWVVTFDNETLVRTIYRDSIVVATDTAASPYSHDISPSLAIGGSPWLNPSDYFHGSIDGIIVFSRILTPVEVKNIYQIGRP